MKYKFECGCEFNIIKEREGFPVIDIDPYNLRLDCKATYELLGKGLTKGCFQVDSNLGKGYCKRLKPETELDLSALGALLRPGCLQNTNSDGVSTTELYCRRKNKEEEVKLYHPAVDNILGNTYNLLCYQEQSLRLSQDIAGFSLQDADILRRGIGHKDTKIIADCKTKFLEGAKKTNVVSEEQAKEIFDWIEKSQRYAFNLCLSPRTRVEYKNGYNGLIDNVVAGDWILAPNSNGIDTYVQVINKHYNGKRQLYRLILTGGESIECTLDHKFYCPDNRIRPLWEIFIEGHGIIIRDHKISSVRSIERLGFEETIDIQVDSNLHCFYGNGIATSNSHSMAYGLTCYITAYLKCHFPLVFYSKWLKYAKDKQDYQKEIRELINEAKLFNIHVLPPTLKVCKRHFSSDNKNVYFGIVDIKGIGEASFEKIKELSQFEDWFQFLINSDHVSSSCINGLIKSGSLREITKLSRNKMLHEYNIWSQLTNKEKDWIKSRQYNELGLALKELIPTKGDGGGTHSKPRSKIVENLLQILENPPYNLDDSPDWVTRQEEDLLGTALTFENLVVADSTNCTCKEFIIGKELQKYIISAEIKSVRTVEVKTGPNKGKEMAFLSVDDGTSILDDLVIFSQKFEEHKAIIYQGNKVTFSGFKDKKKGSLVVRDIFQVGGLNE